MQIDYRFSPRLREIDNFQEELMSLGLENLFFSQLHHQYSLKEI